MQLPKSWQRRSKLSSLCINWLKLLMLCAFQVSYIPHTWLRDLWVCMFITMGALQTHKLNSSWEQGSACDGERLQLWHSQWRCSSCSVGFHSQQSHKFTSCFKYLYSNFPWWKILVQAIGVAALSHIVLWNMYYVFSCTSKISRYVASDCKDTWHCSISNGHVEPNSPWPGNICQDSGIQSYLPGWRLPLWRAGWSGSGIQQLASQFIEWLYFPFPDSCISRS